MYSFSHITIFLTRILPVIAQAFSKPAHTRNMFDDLLTFKLSTSSPLIDELKLYLSLPPENVLDAVQ